MAGQKREARLHARSPGHPRLATLLHVGKPRLQPDDMTVRVMNHLVQPAQLSYEDVDGRDKPGHDEEKE
jgi:hypothetical protein